MLPRPNGIITVTYTNNAPNQSAHTIDIPFYGYTLQDVGLLNDYYPQISNHVSSFSYLHSYSDDDILSFNLHKFFSSLKHNANFKNAPHFIHNTNQSLSGSFSLNAQNSNALQLTLFNCVAGAISTYTVDES